MTKEAEMIEGQMVTVTYNRPDFYYICVLSGPSHSSSLGTLTLLMYL